jgi:hypothetical protein
MLVRTREHSHYKQIRAAIARARLAAIARPRCSGLPVSPISRSCTSKATSTAA